MTHQVSLFHISGESYTVYPLDAREACERHSDEYRMEPWTPEQRRVHALKEAEALRMSAEDRRKRDADTANGKLVVRGPAAA
jgi:hypothetical protein